MAPNSVNRPGLPSGDALDNYLIAGLPAIAGIAEVVRQGHADPTAFDLDDDHYDSKSDWKTDLAQVSIRAAEGDRPSSRLPDLHGQRLGWYGTARGAGSVQPVSDGVGMRRRLASWKTKSKPLTADFDPEMPSHGQD